MADNGNTFWPEPPSEGLDLRLDLSRCGTVRPIKRNRHPDNDDRCADLVDDLFNATVFHRSITDALNRLVWCGHRPADITNRNADTSISQVKCYGAT